MLGMGSGQPNRVESLRIALKKAGDEVKGAALASDAFFPFGNYYLIYAKLLVCSCTSGFLCVWMNLFSAQLILIIVQKLSSTLKKVKL